VAAFLRKENLSLVRREQRGELAEGKQPIQQCSGGEKGKSRLRDSERKEEKKQQSNAEEKRHLDSIGKEKMESERKTTPRNGKKTNGGVSIAQRGFQGKIESCRGGVLPGGGGMKTKAQST